MDITSLVFIMGYLVNIIANGYLAHTVNKDKHIEGLSFQTQIIYAVAAITKMFYFFNTTLSDFFIGYVELLLSLTSTTYLMHVFWKYRKLSIGVEKNFTFTMAAVPACIILSIFVHPGFIQDGFDFASMMIACSVRLFFPILLTNVEFLGSSGFYPTIKNYEARWTCEKKLGNLHCFNLRFPSH